MAQLLKKLLMMGGEGAAVKLLEPSAKNYFDDVGTIWSQERYGYFNAPDGQIACYVQEPPVTAGGGYFNRV